MNPQLLQQINKKIDDMNAKALQEEINGRKDTVFHKYLKVFKNAHRYIDCMDHQLSLKHNLDIELKTMKLYNLATIEPIKELIMKNIIEDGPTKSTD